ncbi:MAG: iron ABC transporter permease [Alphaproteobacteria bacterium]|nr:iron ABC transporter permease [Alphaproteobacteria bacterium]
MRHASVLIWLAAGWVGFALLPWYGLEDGITRTPVRSWLGDEAGTGLVQALLHGRWWLLPLAASLLAPFLALRRERDDPRMALVLVVAGAAGMAWLAIQGFALTHRGWNWNWLGAILGPTSQRQFGMGWGAALTATSLLFLATTGLARRGAMRGDEFITGAIGLVVATVALFVFWPVIEVLFEAAIAPGGGYGIAPLAERLSTRTIWGLGCLMGERSCGVLWNSVLLASIVGVTTTALGLAFALLAHRTAFPAKPLLKLVAVLPVITPPFVIGLAIILLFGRNGAVTLFLESAFGIPPTRWIYGLPGLVLVQTLAFAPIAFMVLLGVVQGVSPSMEEAAQTLRASRWRVFTTVTLPLIRPGLANSFLIGFVESLADFGNPLVLAGNFNVLSTQIFFAIVGAQSDPGRAAALSMVLLVVCLGAFFLQSVWLGKRAYTTVSGKGDGGVHAELPVAARWAIYLTAVPWMAFTLVVYAMIVVGGFVENFGRDNSFTLKHYVVTFGIEWGQHGIVWAGRAWNSLFTTLQLSALAAPLTAGIGLLTAYLLTRQTFGGKQAFEFTTMLSFAIPGTVVGVSYIVAFNVPPLELTGTGIILVICFVFRNMPVAIRSGIATLSQIDRSLDECSLTLRHGSFATLRRVVLPLLRPAIVAAMVYSFVRAITSVSAVVFLVSAEYNLATAYIVNRVEVSEYGVAIAYSSALVVIMAVGVTLIQLAVGERRLGRRAPTASILREASA